MDENEIKFTITYEMCLRCNSPCFGGRLRGKKVLSECADQEGPICDNCINELSHYPKELFELVLLPDFITIDYEDLIKISNKLNE